MPAKKNFAFPKHFALKVNAENCAEQAVRGGPALPVRELQRRRPASPGGISRGTDGVSYTGRRRAYIHILFSKFHLEKNSLARKIPVRIGRAAAARVAVHLASRRRPAIGAVGKRGAGAAVTPAGDNVPSFPQFAKGVGSDVRRCPAASDSRGNPWARDTTTSTGRCGWCGAGAAARQSARLHHGVRGAAGPRPGGRRG